MISMSHVWGKTLQPRQTFNTLRPRQNGFSWMKMHEFRLKFNWSLFPRVRLTIFQQWFWKWLDTDKATSQYLSQWWLDYRRIYASLGLNELRISGKGLILGLRPATERRRYFVTTSLIGWAQTWNQPRGIYLKFGWMMQTTMNHIAISVGHG